jgi:hypothetical protein
MSKSEAASGSTLQGGYSPLEKRGPYTPASRGPELPPPPAGGTGVSTPSR